MAKLGPNDKCPCGSGKKYKKCHSGKANALVMEPLEVKLTHGTAVIGIHGVRATAVSRKDQQIQGWFLERAADAVRDAQMPGAGEFETVKVVLMAAAAAEALANRLLESFLVPKKKMTSDQWDDYERRTSTPDKWMKLYTELEILPTLERGREPLQGMLELFKLRNDLMHFKHGKNLIVTEQWVPVNSSDKRHIDLDTSRLDDAKRVTLQDSEIRERLHPNRAAGYYATVRSLLLGALTKHPDDEHKVVLLLKWITGEGRSAPDVKDLLAPALPADEHQKCRDLLVAIDLAARAIEALLVSYKEQDSLVRILGVSMMARLADVLRGVLVACQNGLGAEAGVLGRIAIEIAITASYIGPDEQRAKHFAAQATLLNQRQRETLAKGHGRKLDEQQERDLAEQMRIAREHFGEETLRLEFPPLRTMAEMTGLLELYDFAYEDLHAVSHCDPRSIFAAAHSSSLSAMPRALGHTAGAANIALAALSQMVPFESPVALHHLRQMQEVLTKVRDSVRG